MTLLYAPFCVKPPKRRRRPAWLRSGASERDIIGAALSDLYEPALLEPLPVEFVALVRRLR